jgi:hypothetical protein
MIQHVVTVFVMLAVVGGCAVHHWGWEGLAIPAAIWLIMPQHTVTQ